MVRSAHSSQRIVGTATLNLASNLNGSYFTREIVEPEGKGPYLALGSSEWGNLCSGQLAFISTG